MALITLNLRNLESGERMLAEFATLDDCLDWLENRPQFIDVLGTVDDSLTVEGETLLKSALRPYDAEEKALMEEFARIRRVEMQRAREAEVAEYDAEKATFRVAIEGRGPNDAMEVRWQRGGTLVHTEPLDERPIPEVVQQAVEAWVKERDGWVHRRGQFVSEAVMTVWPADVPAGEDRVQSGGQFEVEFLDEG
jgi:hypothetical protein